MKYFENLNKIDQKLSFPLKNTENFFCSQMIICLSLQDLWFLIDLVIKNAGFIENESAKCVTYAKKQ